MWLHEAQARLSSVFEASIWARGHVQKPLQAGFGPLQWAQAEIAALPCAARVRTWRSNCPGAAMTGLARHERSRQQPVHHDLALFRTAAAPSGRDFLHKEGRQTSAPPIHGNMSRHII
jgi:hypothetical protein